MRKIMQVEQPKGITFTVKKAAEYLGVSASTLKMRASDWGINTYWDKRGRRYSLGELEDAKKALTKPIPDRLPPPDSRDLVESDLPCGYRFRVYRTDKLHMGYLGCFVSDDPDDIPLMLQKQYGRGTYHLKLLDADYKMTGNNFTVSIDDPFSDQSMDYTRFARRMVQIMNRDSKK